MTSHILSDGLLFIVKANRNKETVKILQTERFFTSFRMTLCVQNDRITSIDHGGPEFGRGAALDLFEGTVEGGDAGETGFKSDIGYPQAGVPEEGFGELYPLYSQEIHKSHVGIVLEQMGKVGPADADLQGDVI
jgi:hypothetical protein